jgi:hypothetical protein
LEIQFKKKRATILMQANLEIRTVFFENNFSNIIFLPAIHVSMKKKTEENVLLTFGKK